MAEKLKKTRPELLKQRRQLALFQRFLPTLLLKKQQIQSEILKVRQERDQLEEKRREKIREGLDWQFLFSESLPGPVTRFVKITAVHRGTRNVAGIKLPVVERVDFKVDEPGLLATPPWTDHGIAFVRRLLELREAIRALNDQERILQQELRKVTQRVNLFEKVKIPSGKENIRLIRIALAEEQTAAVGRSKIAKGKSAA